MKLKAISRHLVKGLRPESLPEGRLISGRGLEGDRAFAFQFLDDSVPESLRVAAAAATPWMSKFHLAQQHDWPALAQVQATFTGDRLRLSCGEESLEASVVDPSGREKLAIWTHELLSRSAPYERAKHTQLSPLRLIGGPDLAQRYTDGTVGPLSLMTQGTLDDLSGKVGRALDWRVFRLNLLLDGAPPWEELHWKGRRIRMGECELEVLKPIARCANIDVNAETGEREIELFAQLRPLLGHATVGVRCEVVRGGIVRPGDGWELMDQ